MFGRNANVRSARKLLLRLTKLYEERLTYLAQFDHSDEFQKAYPSNTGTDVMTFMRGDFLTEVTATLATSKEVEARISHSKTTQELVDQFANVQAIARRVDHLNYLFVRYLRGPNAWLGGPSEEELQSGTCQNEVLFTPSSLVGHNSAYQHEPYQHFSYARENLLHTIRRHPVFSSSR